MISYKRIDLTNLLIFLFIFGSVVLDSGDNLMKLIKVLFVIPCFIYTLRSLKLYFDTYVKWMLGFAVFAGLSIFWALSIANAVYRYQTLVLNFICIYCLLVYLRNRPARINFILKTLFFAPLILGMRVVVSYGLLAFADVRSVDGIMSPNSIGMRAAIAVVLGAFFVVIDKKHRILYLLCIALNAAIVILSASRKAILFMLIPLLLYCVLSQRNSLKFLRNAMFAVLLVWMTYYGMMNIPFIYDIVGNRIETMIFGLTGSGKTDGSTSLRLAMIEWGLEWFKSKPWIGYGLNNYMTLLGALNTSYGSTGVYAHNNYIELLVDLGAIGASIYYFIYIKILLKAVSLKKELAPLQLIMICILASIIVGEYGMVTYIEIYVQTILALTWMSFWPLGEKRNRKEAALCNGTKSVNIFTTPVR